MRRYEIDLENADVWHRVDSLGRRRAIPFESDDHPLLGPGRRSGFPHPVYALGYAWAVSCEYRMIIIDLFTRWEWPDYILELASGLAFPSDDRLADSYEAMVAFESAIAASIKAMRPELADALIPFAASHGLNAVPWGLGWLYRSVPRQRTDHCIEVPVTLPSIPPRRRRTDPRTSPALDALLLYLWLTGGWRDPTALEILHPVVCFECDVKDSPQCDKPLCFAKGNDRPEGLKLRVHRIKSALGVHRPRGRPKNSSRWNNEVLHYVLAEYVPYWALQKEIEPYF